MGSGFELQVATGLIAIELTGQRPLDIERARVVIFDQIAVVGVHDANQVREVPGGPRMELSVQLRRSRRQLSG